VIHIQELFNDKFGMSTSPLKAGGEGAFKM
jgi:hypothetical protein